MHGFTERYFHTGEVAINFAEGPDNGPPLLLIHGLSGQWRWAWRPVIPLISGRWHIYAVDLRGHGRSGRASPAYNRSDYSRDTARFIEGVIGGRVHVIGHSLGALTALGVAAGWPHLVRAFVMEDPPLYTHDRFDRSPFKARFERMQALAASDMTVEELAREAEVMLPDATPETRRYWAECVFQMDPDVYDCVFGDGYATKADSDPLLAAATPRAFLMQASPNLGAALEDAEAARAMQLLPKAQFVKWDDSGHGMHAAFPQRFVDQVEAFLGTAPV